MPGVEVFSPLNPGTQAHVGTAVIDFGDIPTDYAMVDVVGQTGITPASHVRIWFQAETMANNTPENHIQAAFFTRLATSDPIADIGFTIYCLSKIGFFTKKFRIDWLWS